MNKVTKGTLAAAAAGALLLGGVGTYATWSDKTNVAASPITTGHLTVASTVTKGWTYGDTLSTPYDSVTGRIVPGDTLTSTHNVIVDASGDNIDGTITLTGLVAEGEIQVDVVASNMSAQVKPVLNSNNTFTFETAGKHSLDIVVTVKFLSTATGSADVNVNLDQVGLKVTQGVTA